MAFVHVFSADATIFLNASGFHIYGALFLPLQGSGAVQYAVSPEGQNTGNVSCVSEFVGACSVKSH